MNAQKQASLLRVAGELPTGREKWTRSMDEDQEHGQGPGEIRSNLSSYILIPGDLLISRPRMAVKSLILILKHPFKTALKL